MTTPLTTATTAPSTPRLRRARLIVGYLAIAGTLPYLGLKVAWVAGLSIGVDDPGFMTTPTMIVGNAFTAGMELVAILLALAFTHAWGQRIPAPLILFPIWIGTGFLAPIALSAPAIGFQFTTAHNGAGGLDGWVTPMVYGSFIWQGVALLTAFVLYTRVRWARLFTGRPAGRPARPVAVVGAALAVLVGGFRLAWAFGAPGLPGNPKIANYVLEGVGGVLALAAAAAICAIVARRGRYWLSMIVVWVGSGALFAQSFWAVTTSLAMGGSDYGSPVWTLVHVAQVLAGVLLVLALLRTTSRTADDGRDIVERAAIAA
jgi:hypothetical protein